MDNEEVRLAGIVGGVVLLEVHGHIALQLGRAVEHIAGNSVVNNTLKREDRPGILGPGVALVGDERQEGGVDVVGNLYVPLAVIGADDRLVEEAEATLPEYDILLALVSRPGAIRADDVAIGIVAVVLGGVDTIPVRLVAVIDDLKTGEALDGAVANLLGPLGSRERARTLHRC